MLPLSGLLPRSHGHGNDPYGLLRPAFHQLVSVRSGRLRPSVDFVDHELGAGSWLWIRPGQVQRFSDDLAAADGTMVLFLPGFLPPATAAAARLDPPYTQRPLRPTGTDAEGLRQALDHLVYESGNMASLPLESHVEVMRNLVSVLTLRLAGAHTVHGPASRRTPAGETFRRFHEAVERDHAVTRRVEDYAAALGYSPRTLSRVTLAATGVTPKKYIDGRVLLEAKRLLQHSGLPANAVAERLGFMDASDFNKFFRRREGTTPGAFRFQALGAGR
ncbi:helix-turn-helix transcriptional regulator [Streptomyces sp. NBC_00859]|uniref:helix-turn-helix transcriptional regulator n=1 Tax=Streptomyces sp. NBC_00859 TaxID=2903682 RepID=UPI00386CDC01